MKKPIATSGKNDDLITRMLATGSGAIKNTFLMNDSPFYMKKETIKTDLPILNIAFSGDPDGGLVSGLTMFCGMQATYKTLTALYCMKAYFNKFPDAIALFYDNEFSVTPEYLAMNEIDASRIVHIPIEHIEQLKFDITKKLDDIKKGDHVFIMIDSLGLLGSKKEVEDAMNENSAADMSRAKAIRSLFRIITPKIAMRDLPCIVINHYYKEMGLFPKNVVSGGEAATLAPNQIFLITKSQDKDGDDLVGWNFNINVIKSRFIRQGSKLSFTVNYEDGIEKYSGILELAVESGDVLKTGAKAGTRYTLIEPDTGEVIIENIKEVKTNTDEFLGVVLKRENFKNYVKSKFKLTRENKQDEDDEILDIEDEDLELIQE